MKSVLITGGAGFIGSNFIEHFLAKYDDFRVINLDLLTYAGNLENLKSVENSPRYEFVKGDICDEKLVSALFKEHKIHAVIHFAAESHVDNSIATPEIFIKTNIYGTWNLLHCAYKAWMDAPHAVKSGFEDTLFHHISTDEVYGSLGATGLFTEHTPYAPNSPYSASKASSDMLVRSYAHTYGLRAIITNCSNNYGPHQHAEKLIPTIIRQALAGRDIPIYGDGQNVRDWLFVGDHCEAICAVFNHAKIANGGGRSPNKTFFECFNIGGNEEKKNIDIAHKICAYLDEILPKNKSYKEQIRFVKDRAGHDRRYAIDSSKLQKTLGWKPKHSFESGIKKTIEWYIQKYRTQIDKMEYG